MIKTPNFLLLILLVTLFGCQSDAQVNYTANDAILQYNGSFSYGSNFGYYPFRDEELADLAAGNKEKGIDGAGVKSIRPALPEVFFDTFGYDVRDDAFKHYEKVGLKDIVAFVGYPAPRHREKVVHCGSDSSNVFANLYLPIWDKGENGTPVNDENYYALYIYKIVKQYGKMVRFWEIWNEPDLDSSGNGWKSKGMPDNWYENTPKPCDIALKAPVYHYVRMLRISYEVIKSIKPEDYVCVGGLGYPSFMDVILRFTDNPDNGKVSPEYPLKGGAYFDVLSYHAYPHIDGSLRYWDTKLNTFVQRRHSDAAVEGLLAQKQVFEDILYRYGYDGEKFPKKLCIITESNLPRLRVGEFIGSLEAQRNYVMKAAIECQKNNILQFHVYALAEHTNLANSEFDAMGLYQPFNEGTKVNQQTLIESGVAYKSMSDELFEKSYDPVQTQKLDLPAGIGGAAFKDANGEYTYSLWAKTKQDMTENASATFSFPTELGLKYLKVKSWDYSKTKQFSYISAQNVPLNGTPVFIEKATSIDTLILNSSTDNILVFPNPSSDEVNLKFDLSKTSEVTIELYQSGGVRIQQIADKRTLSKGFHQFSLNFPPNLPKGVYFIKFIFDNVIAYKKVVYTK